MCGGAGEAMNFLFLKNTSTLSLALSLLPVMAKLLERIERLAVFYCLTPPLTQLYPKKRPPPSLPCSPEIWLLLAALPHKHSGRCPAPRWPTPLGVLGPPLTGLCAVLVFSGLDVNLVATVCQTQCEAGTVGK